MHRWKSVGIKVLAIASLVDGDCNPVRSRYPPGCFWKPYKDVIRACDSNVTCLWKCCPQGQALSGRTCIPHEQTFSTKFDIFTFNILIGIPCTNTTSKFVIQEDGIHSIDIKNGTLTDKNVRRGFPSGGYCLESREKQSQFRTVAIVCSLGREAEPNRTDQNRDSGIERITFLIYTIGRFITLPFLIATVAVYAVIPELRNLHGKCLMSHVSSLSVGHVFLIVIALGGSSGLTHWLCVFSAVTIYFFLLVNFFWLNAMCFDIWWTFSGHHRMVGAKGVDEQKQFLIYSVYAWGGPVIMLCVCLVIEFAPGVPDSFIRPEFGTKKCWFKDKVSAAAYFSGPVAVLILSNIAFFVFTALNIIKVKRQTSVLSTSDSQRSKNNEQRFGLYLKLFVVMGVTWSIDIASDWIDSPDYIWYITDMTNILQGVFIFFIFVWKARVWRLLQQRFHFDKPQTTSTPRSSSAGLSRSTSTLITSNL